MTGKISRNLDILERSINECGKSVIEDAAIAGKDLDSMNPDELNRFRSLTSRYKNECTCLKTITKEQVEKKGKEISESIKRFTEKATEKGKGKYEEMRPKIEELETKARPKYEEIRGKAEATYGEISAKAQKKFQEIRERVEKIKAEKMITTS